MNTPSVVHTRSPNMRNRQLTQAVRRSMNLVFGFSVATQNSFMYGLFARSMRRFPQVPFPRGASRIPAWLSWCYGSGCSLFLEARTARAWRDGVLCFRGTRKRSSGGKKMMERRPAVLPPLLWALVMCKSPRFSIFHYILESFPHERPFDPS